MFLFTYLFVYSESCVGYYVTEVQLTKTCVVQGPGFQIGVVFSVDLVLKISGKVETEGGFKVAIPDGSSFMIPFNEAKPNVANL